MSDWWPKVRLGEVLRHRKAFITIDDLMTYRRPRVQLHARGIVLRDEAPGSRIKTKKQQVCRAGEFLVAEIDAKVGGFGIVPDSLDGAIVSSHYFLFVPDAEKLDTGFLHYFVRTYAFRSQVEAQGSTNYASIRPADVLSYEMPLPPLEKQRRIVAQIEELAVKLADAMKLQRQVTTEAQALMLAVVTEAVNGPWRRVQLQEAVDSERPITYGIVQAGEHVDGGIPYIRVSDMAKPMLSLAGMLRTSPDIAARYQRSTVREGDIVFAIRATVGKMRFVPSELDGANLTQGTARIAPSDRARGSFLFWALQSRPVTDAIEDSCKGSTFREITLGKLRALTVPLPPIDEQVRIAAFLDYQESVYSKAQAIRSQVAAELDALLPSILDRAFNGDL